MEEERSIGSKIVSFRKENNLTQEELANHLHVTRQAVSNWERDIHTPDFDTLEKLCGRFGVQMDAFVSNRKKERVVMLDMFGKNKSKAKDKEVSKFDVAVGLFYGLFLFLGAGVFFIYGLRGSRLGAMDPIQWAIAFFAGLTIFFVGGLLSHAIITLLRNDKQSPRQSNSESDD